nr:von Willebrand factor C domain-containing protein 2-like [Biomphalaria glabrata]
MDLVLLVTVLVGLVASAPKPQNLEAIGETCKDALKPPTHPCISCPECVQGNWVCYTRECPDECVDALVLSDQCCPVCPNGPNCQHADVIIPYGQVVTLATGMQCSCRKSEWGWGGLEAFCQ